MNILPPAPYCPETPHSTHQSTSNTSRTPNQSGRNHHLVSKLQVCDWTRVKLRRELWHYFTSKNICLFPWETVTEWTNAQAKLQLTMICACPLGNELEESALIGSWQFLSRHRNASWTCEKRTDVHFHLSVITEYCLYWQLTEKTTIAVFMI